MNLWGYITSWEFWRVLGAGAGGGVAAMAVLIWLGKTWLTQRIQRSVDDVYKAKEQQRQADYNTALETHKSILAREVEGWKAGYQKVIDENHVRFSKLHEDRTTAMRRLFQRLVATEEAVGAFVSPVRLGNADEDKLRDDARIAFKKFAVFFTRNRIFFTSADCQLIEKIRDKAKEAYIDFTTYDYPPDELDTTTKIDKRQLQFDAYTSMTEDFQSLRKQLENEFRAAMGLLEAPTTRILK